jgi:catechol 2,3-dioxygenase-like lactoylglutathione lyase family enzyme
MTTNAGEKTMINGVHHVAISTPSVERLGRFYRQVGFQDVTDFEWARGNEMMDKLGDLKGSSGKLAMLRLGNCYLELFEYASPEPDPSDENRRVCNHGITHICLDVTDLDREYERLRSLGMRFHCGPQDAAPGVRTTYGRDPDGNVLELQEVYERPHELAL